MSTSELDWQEFCLEFFPPNLLSCLFLFFSVLFSVFPLLFWPFLAFLFLLVFPFDFFFIFLSFLDLVSLTFLIWMLVKSCNPNSSLPSSVSKRSRWYSEGSGDHSQYRPVKTPVIRRQQTAVRMFMAVPELTASFNRLAPVSFDIGNFQWRTSGGNSYC